MRGAVAPLAGAWIEIASGNVVAPIICVAPLAGAWIEILSIGRRLHARRCRSPRGSVD